MMTQIWLLALLVTSVSGTVGTSAPTPSACGLQINCPVNSTAGIGCSNAGFCHAGHCAFGTGFGDVCDANSATCKNRKRDNAVPCVCPSCLCSTNADGTGSSACTSGPMPAPTPTCPPTPSTLNARWHYKTTGSGSWSSTQTLTSTTAFCWPAQAMEGDLYVTPNTTFYAGYDFTVPGNTAALGVSFTRITLNMTVHCKAPATPTNGTFYIVLPAATYLFNDSNWYPSSDQSSSLVLQTNVTTPDLCSGAQLRFEAGGVFCATASLFSQTCAPTSAPTPAPSPAPTPAPSPAPTPMPSPAPTPVDPRKMQKCVCVCVCVARSTPPTNQSIYIFDCRCNITNARATIYRLQILRSAICLQCS